MKKIILLAAVLPALYVCWKSLEPIPQTPDRIPPPASPTPAKTAPAIPPQPLRATESLEPLSEELAQLDHEIARAGYPEVMMDERLSEEEREELISKVLRSTKLYDHILRLRIASYRKGKL